MFSSFAGLIFLVGLATYVALTSRYVLTERSLGREVSHNTMGWNIPYGIALAGLAVWGFAGLVDGRVFAPLAPLVTTPAIIALSQVTLRRDHLFARMRSFDLRLRRHVEWGLLLLFGLLAVLMIEEPWSWAVLLWGPTYWWLELLLVMTASLFPYLVGRRHGSAVLPACAFFSFVGVAQYFMRKFKNAAILPNDLLALGTAVAVSDQYTYSIDPRATIGVAITLSGLCVLSLLHPTWIVQADDPRRGNVRRDTGKGIASALLCAALVLAPDYMGLFQVQIMYWYSISYYEKQGFLPTFIAVWQDLPVHKPEDYTTDDAKAATIELARAYDEGIGASEARKQAEAQFEQVKPTVIVVMNESFADLSDFDGMHAGYEGPHFFNSVSTALYRGELFVNVHSGGTCNSEFEFLSGNSLGYIGAGKYPYSTFPLDPIDNLARQFKRLGYVTHAMHPNYGTNWNRNKVYDAWDFDTFITIDDFGGMPQRNVDGTKQSTTPTGVPIFHSGVSDEATYQATLDLLAADESPQFIFNVTMQNHGSYNQNNIPEDMLTHYQPTGFYDNPTVSETPERLNEYLSCMEESDRALEWFMARLKELDRPVVLVFFGDHQPSMTLEYNDAWYPNEDDVTHSQRIYHTEYLIWANYNVSGRLQRSDVRDTSVEVLGTIMLDAIGAPLSRYQKAQLAVNQQIQATNLHGYLGADDIWYRPDDDSPYKELYDKMALVEYLNFAEKL
ncbi:MAG: LTA synthase family protein [Acidobacteriota bacterium]|nr:LTA synthase family protein [Acidobacteriota bacterium]